MAKRTKNGQMSTKELEIRRYHRSVKRVKSLCRDSNVELYPYSEAPLESQCVLSFVDYELGAVRKYLAQDNESYFVDEQFYQEISDKALYL